MTPDMEALNTFVEVIERGSYTAAAQRLGISKSIASRRIARLEQSLNARLIDRTTRVLAPTEAGRAFHERCRVLLRDLAEACEHAASARGTVGGLLRLTAPASFAHTLVLPAVAELAHAHPQLEVQVHLDERQLDLLHEGFDLAVRAGPLKDSGFAQRLLCRIDGVVVASPDYLRRHGRPRTPLELARHVGLDHTDMQPHRLWRFGASGAGTIVHFERRVLVNSLDALADLARAGVGIAAVPLATAAPAIERGELQVLLQEHPLAPHELCALFPATRRDLPKVRALVEALLRQAQRPQACWGRPGDAAAPPRRGQAWRVGRTLESQHVGSLTMASTHGQERS